MFSQNVGSRSVECPKYISFLNYIEDLEKEKSTGDSENTKKKSSGEMLQNCRFLFLVAVKRILEMFIKDLCLRGGHTF